MRSRKQVDYFTVATRTLTDNELILGAQYATLAAAEQAYTAACSDCAGMPSAERQHGLVTAMESFSSRE